MNASRNLTILCLVLAWTAPARALAEDRGSAIDLGDDVVSVGAPAEYTGYAGEQVLYVNYAGYSNAASAAQSFQYVVKYFSPFNITVTNQLPAAEPYTKIDVLDSTDQGGHAPVDCDNENPSDMGEVFANPSGSISTAILGLAIAHEVGHTFGLEHSESTGSPPDMMISSVDANGPEPVFRNECFNLTAYDCLESHEKYCPSEQQNSFAELMGLFGPKSNIDTDSSSDSNPDSDSGSDIDSDSDSDSDSDADSNSDAGEDDGGHGDLFDPTRNDSGCGCRTSGGQGSVGLVDLFVSLLGM